MVRSSNGETSDQKAQIWDPWRQLWKDTNKHNAFEDDCSNQGSFTAHLFVLDCK